jgi:DNA-binding IscR family transcriptional regulator
MPMRQASDLLADMVRLGLLVTVQGENGEVSGYQPGRAPETLELKEILRTWRLDGADCPAGFRLPARQIVSGIEEQVTEAEQSALQGMTLKDLVLRRIEERGEE